MDISQSMQLCQFIQSSVIILLSKVEVLNFSSQKEVHSKYQSSNLPRQTSEKKSERPQWKKFHVDRNDNAPSSHLVG